MKNILVLLRIQLLSDFRQKFGLASVLLYMISSAFIAFKVFGDIQKQTWNALFWIIYLFSAISAAFLSFGFEFKQQKDFLHQLFNPLEVFVGKIIYYTVLLTIIGAMLFFTLSIFSEFPVVDIPLFFLCLFLASIGISTCLCFVAALAATAQVNTTVLSILALPLLLPIVLISVKITAVALGFIVDSTINTDILLLVSVDGLILGLGIILFPNLWKS